MNKETITKILLFAVGAAVGSAVTWKLVKTKYEEINKRDIESVIESFSNKEKEDDLEEPILDPDDLFKVDPSVENAEEKQAAINKAQEISARAGYFNYMKNKQNKEEEEDEAVNEPYVISPEEFGEEDYAIITLTYFADGVVANEQGKEIANTDELIGKDFASHFGDYPYDPDAVYVRNDADGVDYEILKDHRAYSELDL